VKSAEEVRGVEKFRVLIVDDEVDFVETIVKRLIDRGLEVAGVHSGLEALDLLDKRDFDVVILDVKMPGMDGIETLRAMKKKSPLTEVIMLTGHGSVESGIQGLQLGAYNYVMKPVPLNDLLKQMTQAYERKLIEEERERQSGR
jgi:DNA-binding NtrC family response regulator